MFLNTKNKYLEKVRPFLDVRIGGLAIFGVIVLLVSWSGISVLQNNYELEKELAEIKQRAEVQKLENENLRLKNTYLESDQYLELSARRQLGRAAEGETVYLVPHSVAMSRTVEIPTEKAATIQESVDNRPAYQKNLSDWIDFMLNRKNE